VSRLLVAALALVLAWEAAAASGPTLPRSSRALIDGLKRTGRLEVALTREAGGEEGVSELRGTLALEPPDCARLDVRGGESITVRAEGGEWLQPNLHQMIRLGPQSAGNALVWWRVMLDPSGAGIVERAFDPKHFLLVRTAEGSGADSAWVTLGAGGLPDRLEISDGEGGRVSYRLGAWRFPARRGRAAFRLAAPKGFEVVDLR
jgi:outer membrane lipoprotein-sorting protein